MKPEAAFAIFRGRYPAKPMRIPAKSPDEMIQMTADDGVFDLPEAPAIEGTAQFTKQLPASDEAAKAARHLWVLGIDSLPFAIEHNEWASNHAGLEESRIKHSNLTGGSYAHCGGELWFLDAKRIVVNGSSGRYGPESEVEFDDLVAGLVQCGYEVASTGFDAESGKPNRLLHGTPNWIKP